MNKSHHYVVRSFDNTTTSGITTLQGIKHIRFYLPKLVPALRFPEIDLPFLESTLLDLYSFLIPMSSPQSINLYQLQVQWIDHMPFTICCVFVLQSHSMRGHRIWCMCDMYRPRTRGAKLLPHLITFCEPCWSREGEVLGSFKYEDCQFLRV